MGALCLSPFICHVAQYLGRHGHLVQWNASGRQAAAERGWSLVDFEAMAQWFAQPQVSACCLRPELLT